MTPASGLEFPILEPGTQVFNSPVYIPLAERILSGRDPGLQDPSGPITYHSRCHRQDILHLRRIEPDTWLGLAQS